MTNNPTRTERDSMGEMQVPAGAYYGASTMRAVLNFPISDLRLPRPFLRALGLVKAAAARTNGALGLLDPDIARAAEAAALEVAAGRWDAHFVVDVFQTGSGTSTNTNANEVIARRAAELLSEPVPPESASPDPPPKPASSVRSEPASPEPGRRDEGRAPASSTTSPHPSIHPNDHVNLCQSSNDVIPTAIQIAAASLIETDLRPALDELRATLDARAVAFWDVLKTGRTHLQDATPVRLGQEFRGYAGQVERALRRLDHARDELVELPLGGTAVGTGVNCDPRFPSAAIALLAQLTALPLRETDNHFAAQSNIDALVEASGVLRTVALSLAKVADDVRWMGSGPRAGLGELALPEVQPGSSIMPGKVNPVIAESLLQVCAQVAGNDAAIALAAQGSHFELNMMLPVAAYNFLQAASLLAAASRNFARQCVAGLEATSRGPDLVASGLALATALAPHVGYDAAAAIAREASQTNESVLDVARRRTAFDEATLRRILDPLRMLEPGLETGAPPSSG